MFPLKNRYSREEYAQMWTLIRQDVRFKVPGGSRGVKTWSADDRRKVREAAYTLIGHQGNRKKGIEPAPGILFETRQRVLLPSVKQTEKLKKELGQGGFPTKFAYVPTTLSPKTGKMYQVTVTPREDKPDLIRIHGVTQVSLAFDPQQMAIDTPREVERKLQEAQELGVLSGTYGIVIDVGRHQITTFEYDENTVGNAILQLQSAYGRQSAIVKRDPNRHWENWLRGITVRKAGRQKSLNELMQAMELHKQARRRGRKSHAEYVKKKKAAQKRFKLATRSIFDSVAQRGKTAKVRKTKPKGKR